MLRLVLLGLLSAAFFSSTFILNEVMSLAGGHWFWSASLRYAFTILLLGVWFFYQGGLSKITQLQALFCQHWLFWIMSGSIGFGLFYLLICFAADFSPAWVVTATWQFTVVASLFVFGLFGNKIPKITWAFSVIIFLGVCLINVSHTEETSLSALISGGLPVLIAAFCYPLGNQLVWEAKHGQHPHIPKIDSPLLDNALVKVLMLSLGSIPLWLLVGFIVQPAAPSGSQVFNTALVAIFSGIIATSIFLHVRNDAKNTSQLAAVDATQSGEVIFALAGGLLFLNTDFPNVASMIGIAIVLAGLLLFVKFQRA